jgi:hypothetical protein
MGTFRTLASRLHRVVLAEDADPAILNSAALNDVAKWSAAGFTALAAILTFFGIKEGVLDRLLRADPTAALFVFILVGLGVLSGIIAPAFETTKRIYVFFVVFAVTTLAVLTWLIMPNLDQEGRGSITLGMSLGLLVTLIAAAVVLNRVPVSLKAAVLVFGVACTSIGLYGAAKLSVLSKTFGLEPQVTATIRVTEGRDVLDVSVSAERQDDKVLLVEAIGVRNVSVNGVKGRQEHSLGAVRLAPDGTGVISTTVSFPVVRSAWHKFIVRSCDAESCSSQNCSTESCSTGIERLRLAGTLPELAPRLSGALGPGSSRRTARATVKAEAMPADMGLAVSVIRYRAGTATRLGRAAVLSNGNGIAAWAGTLRSMKRGDRLVLRCQLCSRGLSKCQGPNVGVATYLVPA